MGNASNRVTLPVTLLLTVCLLAGCGGGDSGNDTNAAGASGDASASNVPLNPPALPKLSYGGNTSAASIDDYDGEALAAESFVMLNTIVSLSFSMPRSVSGSARTVSHAELSIGGGGAALQGQINADHSGWLSITYFNYSYVDETGKIYTYNGMMQARYAKSGTVTLGISSLHLSGEQVDQTVSGIITVSDEEDAQGFVRKHYVADLVLTDNLMRVSIKAANFVINGAKTQTVTGRLYDSRFGYMAVRTLKPLQYTEADNSLPPFAGGPLVASSNGLSARLAPLNENFAAIGLDLDGNGLADESLRVDWHTGLPDTAPTPTGDPEADLAGAANAVVNEPAMLEGRYSHAPDGRFLHYHWQLALAPAGSQAKIDAPWSATATFTPDVPGDYLVRLEVSNESGSSTDTLVVTAVATAPSADAVFAPRSVLDAGPDRSAALGKPVALDALTSILVDNDYGSANYQWTLHAPPGSQAVFNNAQVAQPEFTPDLPGIYYATLSDTDATDTAESDIVVTVGDAPHFDRPVALVTGVRSNTQMAIGDLNGDGLPDIVLAYGTASPLEVLYSSSVGRFASPVEIEGDAGSAVAIVDLDGDGRDDLVAASEGNITYRLQLADGSLGPAVAVAADFDVLFDCMSGAGQLGGVTAARLFGASLPSLVQFCPVGVLVYGQTTDGAIDKPWYQRFGAPPAMNYSGLTVADVTGDGIADLVGGYLHALYFDYSLAVVAGNPDGTFSATPTEYPLEDSEFGPRAVKAADFNQDGRRDIAVFRGGKVNLYNQQVDGTLGGGQTLTLAIPATDMTVADASNDGRVDLILRNGNRWNSETPIDPRALTIYPQQSGGGFSDGFLYPGVSPMRSGAIQVADINADGVADLISLQDDQLDVILGDPQPSSAASAPTTEFDRPTPTQRPAAPLGQSARFRFTGPHAGQ